ncbi:MAG: metallophosphoesterase, partial [Deltaproteobacteria bacterium]|nr:metallophosphoesterase [Deltaproteobacteria bacterium]
MIVVKPEECFCEESPAATVVGTGSSPSFILAHLSDPHFFSPTGSRLSDFLNKRLYGYLSWRWRRRYEHSDKVVLALIKDLKCQHPDHIAVTGDLTHLGLPDEYRLAAEFLRLLGPPEWVTVIPGNHDAYVASAWEQSQALWTSYLVGDSVHPPGGKPKISFPFIRERGEVVLIGLSTAHPCLPLLATGTIGEAQLQRLEALLNEYGSRQQCRVILIHHHPVPGVISWRKRLTDYRAFCDVLKRQGAELVLHGHAHFSSCSFLETPAGHTPIIGVPSASAIGRRSERRSEYNLYHIDSNDQGWQVQCKRRRYSVSENNF